MDWYIEILKVYGPLGIMAALFIWMFFKKDQQLTDTRNECHQELKALYDELKTIVEHATEALADKSHSDEKLADALEKLADKIDRKIGG